MMGPKAVFGYFKDDNVWCVFELIPGKKRGRNFLTDEAMFLQQGQKVSDFFHEFFKISGPILPKYFSIYHELSRPLNKAFSIFSRKPLIISSQVNFSVIQVLISRDNCPIPSPFD